MRTEREWNPASLFHASACLAASIASSALPRAPLKYRLSNTAEIAVSMVAAGLGVAPLPLNAREVSPKVRVKSLALEQPIVPRRVAVFTRRETRLTPAAAAFRQFLDDYLTKSATRTALG